ncbi:1,4-dihydroxy-2-naphthoate octaprenyltransferase [uncultured Veillonella sp.]|uniref:1,4-dihydroxy-2-naphthoate octaprenyltransferase n=1 Tax=uncultured Veillonella sp. TaxID=159268 RepID=UPI0026302D80|nr:1,4-dihydroxy-2-naphthoate octaprenyltransferase [uncultured Veillonella sp.]
MTFAQFYRLSRPRTLTAAFSPVILGATYGSTMHESVHPWYLALLYVLMVLVCVMSAQIAANIWNEYFDFKSGLDLNQVIGNSGSIVKEGISPSRIKKLGYVFSLAPLIIGIILAAIISWWFIPIGAICILISLFYSGGPKPISRTPYGELASGVAMGFAIVCITAYTITGTLYWDFIIPAIPSTILIGNIMMTNNLRDFSNDQAHGRRTLVIRLGKDRGIALLRMLFIGASLWLVLWILLGYLPYYVLLAFISLIPAFKSVNILKLYADPLMTNQAMKFTSISVTLYHVLTSLGLLFT